VWLVLFKLTKVIAVGNNAGVTQTEAKPTLQYRDLAPSIVRQRLVVEGTRADRIDAADICDYLRALADVCDMKVLTEPVTHRSDRFGWAGWVHWETSGAHFYAWEEPRVFFSVDIYTCKAFDAHRVVEFTRAFFSADEVVAKEF
jgi:S-adenosylmethionine decarboxylase